MSAPQFMTFHKPVPHSFVILTLLWIIVLGIYWNTTLSMVRTWYGSVTFQHGFLVFPISGFLIWTLREELAKLKPDPKMRRIIILTGPALVWLLGELTHTQVVQQVAMIVMLQAIAWILLGTPLFVMLLFPLAFLLFAVPMGEFLVPWLQDFTAFFTVKSLQLSGIPVFWEGRSISIPGQTWLVAESCSGIRYVISMMALGCLFAWIFFRSWVRRIVFILASLFLPVIFNGFRAYAIVLLSYFSGGELASGVDHFIYGWIIFLLLLFPLCWLGYRWSEKDLPTAIPLPQPPSASKIFQSSTSNSSHDPASPFFRQMALTASAVVMLLIIPPVLAENFPDTGTRLGLQVTSPPKVYPPWQAIHPSPVLPGRLTFPDAQAVISQGYDSGEKVIHFTFVDYGKERQAADAIGYKTAETLKAKDGRVLGERSEVVTVNDQQFWVQESIMAYSIHGPHMIWHWYVIGDQFTSNPYWAKILQIKAQLGIGIHGTGLIIISTPYTGQPAVSRNTLQDFLQHAAILDSLKPAATSL
jgi:exosortase A